MPTDSRPVRAGPPDLPPEAPPAICDICGSAELVWRNCKLICQNCHTILQSCADL